MKNIKYYIKSCGFAFRKNARFIAVFVAVSILMGLSGFFIGDYNVDSNILTIVFQRPEHWCVFFTVVFTYCAAVANRRTAVDYSVAVRYYNFGLWTVLFFFCIIEAVAFGLASVSSNLIAKAVYGDAVSQLFYLVSPDALFSAMAALWFRCFAFAAVAFFFEKLLRVNVFFLAFSVLYGILLLLFYQALTTPLPENGFLTDFITFFFYEKSWILAVLKSLMIAVPVMAADLFLSDKRFAR